MVGYKQGYDEDRFEAKINQNFICLICFNVLRDPVLCPRNQHIFCRCCITKYLENSQACPTCADPMTVENLIEPQRIVKDYLDELNIRCEYAKRGCHEVIQLQHLDHHEATCGFQPAICTNQGCGETVSKRDLIHHESELCPFRKLKCHSCDEMATTLAEMEKRMAKMESKMETMETNQGNMEKNLTRNVERIMEAKMKALNETMTDVKKKLSESKVCLKRKFCVMDDTGEEFKEDQRTASEKRENILVAGGVRTDFVEIFNLRRRKWSFLQALPQNRFGATSFVYNGHVTVAGGKCAGSGHVDDMIRMNTKPIPDLSSHWSDYLVTLPAKLAYHSNVLYNDQLIVSGGKNESGTSDCIHEIQLALPHNVKTTTRMPQARMPQPRRVHCTELFDDNMLIVGGRTTTRCEDSLDSVVQYDIKKKECKSLAPLPYAVSAMATVRWADNFVVIGGIDKHGNALDTVVIYNTKTEEYHMLPPMRCKRWGCAAVVVGNVIVVLGGKDEKGNILKSVESFSFHRYTWEELEEMSEGRAFHTAVVV